MLYEQIEAPVLGSVGLSAFAASLPLFFFFWALAVRKMKGWKAGLYTLAIGLATAVFVYGMPVAQASSAALFGGAYALFPIVWIILPAVFLYKIAVATGYFESIRYSITVLTEDRRYQALLVAFAFGSFLEGAAGFGTPVAIGAAILTGLGFRPMRAAGICLVANIASVAFGGVGVPIIAFEGSTGIPAIEISKRISFLLPVLSLIIPFYVIVLMAGFRKAVEVLPGIIVMAVSYSATQSFFAYFLGPELPDIAAAFVSMIAFVLFIRWRKPRNIFRFEQEESSSSPSAGTSSAASPPPSMGHIIRAWSPYVLMTLLIGAWGLPAVKKALAGKYTGDAAPLELLNRLGNWLNHHLEVPFLHEKVLAGGEPIGAIFKLELLGAGGTAIFLTAIATKWILRVPWSLWWKTLGGTLQDLRFSILTVVSVIGFSYVANYSGMCASIGGFLALSGAWFPLVSPIIGWIGVFITGSDTSANVLFGQLQAVTAQGVGMDPSLALAANTVGGGTAKMISPQSIAVAVAAIGLNGRESELLRYTIRHSLFFLALIALATWIMS